MELSLPLTQLHLHYTSDSLNLLHPVLVDYYYLSINYYYFFTINYYYFLIINYYYFLTIMDLLTLYYYSY